MPKSGEVASELRRLADALDKEPETDIQVPTVWFHCDRKEHFLNVAKLALRPLKKTIWTPGSIPSVRLSYEAPAMNIEAVIDQSHMCRLVKPAQEAVYECDPLLSQEEEDSLVQA